MKKSKIFPTEVPKGEVGKIEKIREEEFADKKYLNWLVFLCYETPCLLLKLIISPQIS